MILKLVIGAAAGAVLGFGYFKLVGCPSGGFPLVRYPWITTLYGEVLGALFAGSSR